MLHQPDLSENEGDDLGQRFRTHVGVRLFLAYALAYGIFVAINLVSPLLMERIVLFGLNLAVTYGIGLIVFAIVLALVYNRMCEKKELALKHADSHKKEG